LVNATHKPTASFKLLHKAKQFLLLRE